MKVVVAIDSFKGCLTSVEANGAAAQGVLDASPEACVVQVPVSDGGEGFLDAFRATLLSPVVVECRVSDPLMRPVDACYLLSGETAVVEMARASGLMLLNRSNSSLMMNGRGEGGGLLAATTYGTGQLVADAVSRGAKHVIVGLGGSATNDDGRGLLQALADGFVPEAGGVAFDLCWERVRLRLHGVRFTVATDVCNPLYGPEGAACVFAAQKGATPAMIQQLDERSRRFAQASARLMGFDRSGQAGAGAAGGLGYAFLQYLDAERRSGVELLLEMLRFDHLVGDADLVVTGEGSADRQTLMGKLPMGILKAAGRVPVGLVAGRVTHRDELLKAGFSHVECINPVGLPLEEALRPATALQHLRQAVRRLF